MHRLKHAVFGTAAIAAIACTPVATAGAHGFGHLHPWGLGRGLLGAVFGLATLPLAIASAALSANEPEEPHQSSPGYGGPRGYAPPPAYYAAPQTYYAPPQNYYAPPQNYYAPPPAYYGQPRPYYPRAPVYSSAPRAYYAPHTYYAPRPSYYGGYASYRAGAYAYPRR